MVLKKLALLLFSCQPSSQLNYYDVDVIWDIISEGWPSMHSWYSCRRERESRWSRCTYSDSAVKHGKLLSLWPCGCSALLSEALFLPKALGQASDVARNTRKIWWKDLPNRVLEHLQNCCLRRWRERWEGVRQLLPFGTQAKCEVVVDAPARELHFFLG